MISGLTIQNSTKIYKILEGLRQNPENSGLPIWDEKQLESEMKMAQGLGLWRQGELVAFILYRETANGLEIQMLGTHPNWQGQGCMSELLRFFVEQLPQGAEIWLEVHQGNQKACRLYERIGFKLVGKRPKYYRDGGAASLYTFP